jgi:hypothetical protein
MIIGEAVIGLLFVDDGGAARAFTDVEQQMGLAFAALAASAIAQAKADHELRQAVALDKARTEKLSSDGGDASSSVHSGASSDVYTQLSSLTRHQRHIYQRTPRPICEAFEQQRP